MAIAVGFFIYGPEKNIAKETFTQTSITLPLPPEPEVATIMFVGDIMMDRGVESSVQRNFDGDFEQLFDHLDILEKADIVFGNLEGPVSDIGHNVGSKYSFRMNPAILPILKNHGFDIVSFANNHVGDWSQSAFEDTLARLEKNNIAYTGAGWNTDDAEKVRIIESHGIRIGFVGFTDVGPNWMQASNSHAGILLASDPNLENIITIAKQDVDILIASFHWGVEYAPFNDRQETLAKRALDAGADMVIGHHPHVTQEIKYYDGKLVAYSLGNFIFDQYFSDETMQGLLLEITVDKDDIVDTTEHVIELGETYQPIKVRPATDDDFIKRKVTVPSLCPETSGRSEDKWLFPVDRTESLGSYKPSALTHMNNRVETRGTATCLVPKTADALESMFTAMLAENLKPVMTSGYRPYDVQKVVYENWLERQNDTLPAYPAVAEPGHSEHQLGTTVDLKSLQTNELSYDVFHTSPEYTWLTQHAHEYGFVQSYPEGKESQTGYIPEAWHWRYIGTALAKEFHNYNSNLTLVEFLQNKN